MKTLSHLTRAAKTALAGMLLAGLAACGAPSFRADVSRFLSQLPAPQGQSFAVVAEDPSLAGGLEFALYADYVEQHMAELGYRQAASPEAATLLVRFDYGVDTGRERVYTSNWGYRRDPFYRPWYSYTPVAYRDADGNPRVAYVPTRTWNYYDPFYDSYYGRGVDSYTVFTSGIDLKIDDAASGERLFEGRAEALSTTNRLQYLIPNLIEAMFTDFPGNSGETVRISIAPEDQPVQRSER